MSRFILKTFGDDEQESQTCGLNHWLMLHLSSGVVRERRHPEQPVGALLPTPTGFLKLFQNLWGNLLFSERVVTWKGFSSIGQTFLLAVRSQSWQTESPREEGPSSPRGAGSQWSLRSRSVASADSSWPCEGVPLPAGALSAGILLTSPGEGASSAKCRD